MTMVKLTRSEAGKLGKAKTQAIHQKQYADRVAKYLEAPKLCRNCHNPHAYNKRYNDFCSQSCAATYNNSLRIKQVIVGQVSQPKLCLRCGKLRSKGSEKYCSLDCMMLHRMQQAIEDGTASVRTIRGYLLKTKPTCSNCGLSEWLGNPIPLDTHHVDGNSENNEFRNLVLICPNCHALTPNYKNRNKGNGRFVRRVKYQQGKSY